MNKYMDKLLGTAPANSAVRAALSVPFPRERLVQILDEARERQLAGIMLELNNYDFVRFHRSLYDHPVLCQKRVLEEMLKASKNTEFGKKYGFQDISSVRDFREKVPLSTWNDYEDDANRLTKGEADILFPGKATFFYRTSGTTAAFKFIPESEREETARKAINMDI